MKTPAEHGLINPVGPVIAAHQQHGRQIGVTTIGVEIGAGLKSPDFHGLDQAAEFLLKDIQIAVGKQQ